MYEFILDLSSVIMRKMVECDYHGNLEIFKEFLLKYAGLSSVVCEIYKI